jgi:hypothetical protein
MLQLLDDICLLMIDILIEDKSAKRAQWELQLHHYKVLCHQTLFLLSHVWHNNLRIFVVVYLFCCCLLVYIYCGYIPIILRRLLYARLQMHPYNDIFRY